MTTTIERPRVPTTRPALVRPVGARFARAGYVEPNPTGMPTVRVYPVGARFPRRSAAEAIERVPMSWAGACGTGEPVGARFPRTR